MRFHFGLGLGGTETMIARQVPRLNAGRYRVSICLLRHEGLLAEEVRAAGVPVHLLRTSGRLRPTSLARLQRFLRRHRVDIAHAHSRSVYVPVTVAARLAGVPVVIGGIHELHSIRGPRRALQERLLDPWRTRMVAVSDEVAEDYCRTAGLPRERCVTIHNGIDAAAFREGLGDRAAVRRELGVGPQERLVLSVGRLHAQKAHEVLIRAAAQLIAERPGLPVQFRVAGEGVRRDELEGLVRAAGLAERFRFLGPRRDVPDLLHAADAFCLSSNYEGFSNVILESLVMGVPVVTTDSGGAREAVVDGQGGFVVPIGDARALADRLGLLLADDALRTACAAAAGERGRAFTLDANLAATESLYDELLGQRAAA